MTDIEAMKRNIEVQLEEYAQAQRDYLAWMAAWRARQPKGFIIKEKSPNPGQRQER
jgi:hypothetical protein